MAGEPIITVVGNLTDDPDMRVTNNGREVVKFVVASTPRFRSSGGDWQDGTTLFQRCALWGPVARNIANSKAIRKGTQVMVTGRLQATEWDDKKTGEKRYGTELNVDDFGVTLKFVTVPELPKASRSDSGRERQPGGSAPADDPWSDEPPF